MKYFNVRKKGSTEEYTVLSEEQLAKLQNNPRADLEIGEEVNADGRTKKEAADFKKVMDKEKRF